MSWFARIEQACAAFIERTFAKTFPSDLEPAQVARKLVATMEARTRGDEGHLLAPGSYVVYVNPEDFSRLAEHRGFLEREWAELLRDMASRVGVYFFDGGPKVAMERRDSVPPGAVDVIVASDLTIEIKPEKVSTGALKRYHLRMIKGVPAYGVYLIDGVANIGRSEDSDIFLVDPSVSRNHAVVEIGSEGPMVRDLTSTNGTQVNGEKVQARRLVPGDVLTFGNTELRLEARE